MIYVEDMKKMIYELNGYKENDKVYTFYYDETNNYRKVRIRENGFNDENILRENYVLGGICIKQQIETNISDILDKMNIQPGQEIKANMFFRGKDKFEECIRSRNLTHVLDWILENAYIHYLDMDNFYFTVIDIVDSIINDPIANKLPHELIEFLKDELYMLLKANINYFIKLCNLTKYPNLSEENVKVFCNGIIFLIDSYIEKSDDEKKYMLELLRQLFKSKRNSKELIFLKDNENMTIVEGYYSNRQQRCIIFQNSYHIFDKEDVDETSMEENNMILKDGNILKNYEFKDSKHCIEIQISDTIVKLIAKYLSFLTNNDQEYIDNAINKLNEKGKQNFIKLIEVIDKSDKENHFFISTVNACTINNYRYVMNQHVEFLLQNNQN